MVDGKCGEDGRAKVEINLEMASLEVKEERIKIKIEMKTCSS